MDSLTYRLTMKKDLDPRSEHKTGTIRNPCQKLQLIHDPLCFQNPPIRSIYRINPQSVRFLRPNPSIRKPIHPPPHWTYPPRTYPETVILGANQKAGNLWGQECLDPRALPSCAWQTDARGQKGEGSGIENCWYFFTADLPGTPKCIKFGPTGISQFPSVEGGKII